VVAAFSIFHSAYLGFLAPKSLNAPIVGLAINAGASLINGVWAWLLLFWGRRWRLGLKFAAYWLTGSIALYSDALESIINVVAAGAAFVALRVSAGPPRSSQTGGTCLRTSSPRLASSSALRSCQ
jgi:divalent metal cation (Fe/Co/Zn/Cd) transporter